MGLCYQMNIKKTLEEIDMNRLIILTFCLFSTSCLHEAVFAADFSLHERLSAGCGCGGGGTVEKKTDEIPEDKIPPK